MKLFLLTAPRGRDHALVLGAKKRRPRVLIAGTHRAIELLEELLRDHAEIVGARSVRDALERLDDGEYDTIACNVRFDESRMFEFLQGVRERPGGEAMRVVSFRAGGG